MSVTNYETVVADNHNDLNTQMTARIADGWQPYGNPILVTSQLGRSFQIFQAVIKGAVSGSGQQSSTAWDDIAGKPTSFPPEIGKTKDKAMAGDTVIPSAYKLTAATAKELGGVKQIGFIADLTKEPTKDDINAILAALKAAGIMPAS